MKDLSEMTLDELWQLFPIVLSEYNLEWINWYADEKAKLLALLDSTTERIDHIGSTSVPGLVSKPTVDILLQVHFSTDAEHLKTLLKNGGWWLMQENGLVLDFQKGYTPSGFAERVYHLHVKPVGDYDELYFRDYLAAHPETAAEYAALKRELSKQFEHNRDGYTEAKTDFVRYVVAKARSMEDL
jgi:GrpB-like predicted nucleotidyltransferase (UPF0157 family)